ncbi:MAG: hypothetical protein K2J18_06115, partial [Paramuribaculum sp.]|nr:hypothetical protein [Paramuribaculum sp.]
MLFLIGFTKRIIRYVAKWQHISTAKLRKISDYSWQYAQFYSCRRFNSFSMSAIVNPVASS